MKQSKLEESGLTGMLNERRGVEVLGTGFPAQMVDDEAEAPGYEVIPRR